jgi:hypothetical protein
VPRPRHQPANRSLVADPAPAETVFPVAELDRPLRHGPHRTDCPLEGDGFKLLVPHERDYRIGSPSSASCGPREAPDFFFRRRDARDPFGAQVLFVKAGTTPHKVAVHSMEPMMSQIKPRVELSRPARHATA